MCGIYGVLDRRQGSHHAAMAILRGELAHRGPDDEGWWTWSPDEGARRGRGRVAPGPAAATLGHARLSIIDLSKGGWQPMSSPDGRWHLTYNGEIYNYLELRSELASTWDFQSESDTEVLLAAWATWGPACVDRLVGMFALCAVDVVDEVAWLAVDPFGIKPLFLVEAGDRLSFASEIGAMVRAGWTERRIHTALLYEYLRHGSIDHRPETMVTGVRRLLPGTVGSFSLKGRSPFTSHTYWELPTERNDSTIDDCVEEVAQKFRRSVELHVRSDVPVGCALSGGIDSSAILCTMREVLGPGAEVHAFGYVAEDPRYDEERWIDLVGDAAGAVTHKVRVSATGLGDVADDLIVSQGEPFGTTSIVAQRFVFEAAREAGVPVLLDGQGADELFGGYRSSLASHLAGLARHGRLLAASRLTWEVSRRPDVHLDVRLAARVVAPILPARTRARLLGTAGLGPFPAWLDSTWFREHGVDGSASSDPASLDEALRRAFTRTSLPSLLRFEDRNSMRFSVESRVPFLEPDLVRSVFSMPTDALVSREGITKFTLRRALRGVVPDAVLDRRDKVGFTTPGDRWLRELSPWVERTLAGTAMERLPGLNSAVCLAEWEEMRDGRRSFDWRAWRWVNAARWAELLDLCS